MQGRNRIRLFRMILGAALLLGGAAQAPAVVIDGHPEDWEGKTDLPIPVDPSAAPGGLGTISSMKISQDDDFLYVFLSFAAPRPFARPDLQDRLIPGVWDDFSYVEIDRDGDGEWDYATRMVRGKRIGMNNLMILRRIEGQNAGRVVLEAEGRKDYRPLGPKAFFTPDGKSVELRIPRLPLRMQRGVVYVRARVRYRDDRTGSAQWVTRYHPGGNGWVGVELRPIVARGENNQSDSPARTLEPVISRSEFENEVGPRYAAFHGAYMYPWRTITPSTEVGSRPLEEMGTAMDAAVGRPAGPARSVIVVTPEGDVRSGEPASSSEDPEEGQGVPAEVSPEAAPSEAHQELGN